MVGELGVDAQRGLNREDDVAGNVGNPCHCSYCQFGFMATAGGGCGENLPASAGLATEPIAAMFQVPKSSLLSLEELLVDESEEDLFTKHIFDDPGLLSACSDGARLEFGESPNCVQISCLVAKFFSIGSELITSDAFQSFDDWAAITPSMAALSTMNGMVIERKSRALSHKRLLICFYYTNAVHPFDDMHAVE